jgi:hypothetical protein
MKTLIVVLVAVFSASASLAADDSPPLTKFSRHDPALRLVERSDSYEKGSYASWKGRVRLTGKLVLEFERNTEGTDEVDLHGVAAFEPDEVSRRKLPAALNNHALPVNTVRLQKTAVEVLEPLIGAVATKRLIAAPHGRFEYPAEVTLVEFHTSLECDHRSYWIKVSEVRLRRAEMVASSDTRNLGC